MRVVFMGTPDYAVPALAELVSSGHEVVCVYTQPPRRSGRGHKVRRSPVHALAEDLGIEVRTPRSFKQDSEKDAFAALDADVAIVVAYGLILPQAILDAPIHGCLNLHGSLLPRWRGAAPIQRAIMAGDTETGVQLMKMEAGLDTGPVMMSERTSIDITDTYETLSDRMSRLGADILPRALGALERGGLPEVVQDEDGATYAAKITPVEARVDWTRPSAEIDRHVRGLSPFPGAWTTLPRPQGEPVRIKLLLSHVGDICEAHPGEVVRADDVLSICCGDGTALDVLRAQRPGARAQATDELLRGFSVPPGTRLS